MQSTGPDRLPLFDTTQVYGRISRLLHWAIAALILWQLVGMGLRLLLGRNPVVFYFVSSHQPVGTLLFVLISIRIIWMLVNRRSRPDHGTGLLGLAAKLGHVALYLAMFLVPASALLRAYGSDQPFRLLGVEIFSAKEPAIGWMMQLGSAHGLMGWLLALLIAGHVAMVGLHESMWKDGTLAKMAGRKALRSQA